jgi:hypothetical protein
MSRTVSTARTQATGSVCVSRAPMRDPMMAVGMSDAAMMRARVAVAVLVIAVLGVQVVELERGADRSAHAHDGRGGCDALTERQLKDDLHERDGDNAAADPEQPRRPSHDRGDEACLHLRHGAMLAILRLGIGLSEQLPAVDDGDVREKDGEDLAQGVPVHLVAEVHAGQDRDEGDRIIGTTTSRRMAPAFLWRRVAGMATAMFTTMAAAW